MDWNGLPEWNTGLLESNTGIDYWNDFSNVHNIQCSSIRLGVRKHSLSYCMQPRTWEQTAQRLCTLGRHSQRLDSCKATVRSLPMIRPKVLEYFTTHTYALHACLVQTEATVPTASKMNNFCFQTFKTADTNSNAIADIANTR